MTARLGEYRECSLCRALVMTYPTATGTMTLNVDDDSAGTVVLEADLDDTSRSLARAAGAGERGRRYVPHAETCMAAGHRGAHAGRGIR